MADINGLYRTFGLELAAGHRERCDHLSVELEFLAFLLLKEAFADGARTEAQAAIARAARQRFLERHLCRWVPRLRDRLRRAVPGSAFADYLEWISLFVEREWPGAAPVRPGAMGTAAGLVD